MIIGLWYYIRSFKNMTSMDPLPLMIWAYLQELGLNFTTHLIRGSILEIYVTFTEPNGRTVARSENVASSLLSITPISADAFARGFVKKKVLVAKRCASYEVGFILSDHVRVYEVRSHGRNAENFWWLKKILYSKVFRGEKSFWTQFSWSLFGISCRSSHYSCSLPSVNSHIHLQSLHNIFLPSLIILLWKIYDASREKITSLRNEHWTAVLKKIVTIFYYQK